MRQAEDEQRELGDTFWGIEQRAHRAQITIKVWLRRCRLRRRAQQGKKLFEKSMVWEVLESNRIAQERQEARLREEKERQEYMRQFFSVPALAEQPEMLSPERQIVMPLPARLRPVLPTPVNHGLSKSSSEIEWWDNASGTSRPRFRSDSLASLADPRRVSGTFASDLASVAAIRSQISSIRSKAQQFAFLELPKVGKSDAKRRRDRKARKRGKRANGLMWFAEKADRKTLRERHRETQWQGTTRKNYQEEDIESRRKRVKQRREQRERRRQRAGAA